MAKLQQMLPSEKEISFLNNYFIYKKVRNVEIKDINLALANSKQQNQEFQQEVQILSQLNQPPPLPLNDEASVPVPVAEVPVAEVPVAEVPVAEVPVAEVPVAQTPAIRKPLKLLTKK